MPAATLGSAIAVKKAVEKLVEDIYDLGKGELGKQLSRWRAKAAIDGAYKKLKHIRNIKTIWQVEKAVDIAKFYYPSRVLVDQKPVVVNDLADLPSHGNLIIEGTVGQGKSIFFRYLASRELVRGQVIPLFVELRRIRDGQSLTDHLRDELASLGLETDEDTLNFLAQHGKLTLFLDGFDEVPETRRANLVSDVEHFSRRHEKTRVLISSRPNSGVTASALFRVFHLAPLAGDDYEGVVHCLAHSEALSTQVVEGVRRIGASVISLLTTPLMVALLMIRYKVEHSIPENTVAFYDGLFLLLLQRHDKLKAGYVRPRASGLSDASLQDTFDALCYLSRKADAGTFTLGELHELTKQSLHAVQVNGDAATALQDITTITCLVLEEGGECRFIHRSVQEYHAAHFIKGRPDDIARRFYEAMPARWQAWRHELTFLATIDRYRFLEWFFIPDCLAALNLQRDDVSMNWHANRESALLLLGSLRVVLSGDPTATFARMAWPPALNRWCLLGPDRVAFERWCMHLHMAMTDPVVTKLRHLFPPTAEGKPEDAEPRTCFTVQDLMGHGLLEAHIRESVDGLFRPIHQELLSAIETVHRIEETKAMFQF